MKNTLMYMVLFVVSYLIATTQQILHTYVYHNLNNNYHNQYDNLLHKNNNEGVSQGV